ncbi:hypothetical protein [Kibdelosporangium philippinense]
MRRLDEISAWLADKEPTPENRRELLERYAARSAKAAGTSS